MKKQKNNRCVSNICQMAEMKHEIRKKVNVCLGAIGMIGGIIGCGYEFITSRLDRAGFVCLWIVMFALGAFFLTCYGIDCLCDKKLGKYKNIGAILIYGLFYAVFCWLKRN